MEEKTFYCTLCVNVNFIDANGQYMTNNLLLSATKQQFCASQEDQMQ